MNICIIGTGYVGLVTGTCMAKTGHKVVCYDIDHNKINLLNKGIVPFYEPHLAELVIENLVSYTIEFSSDLDSSIKNSNLVIIAVGTPTLKNGEADMSQINEAAREIGHRLDNYKVIAIKSTVPVGTCSYIEGAIKKNLKHSCLFDVVSNPEFLREGSAVHDMLHADRIIIGSESEEAISIMEEAYLPFGKAILHTKRENAELIKYASNAFLATKISFINEIANFCEKVGADIIEVAKGMGLDSRIGKNFLNAGIGFGGSCFPKDLKALINSGDKVGYDFKLARETLKVNESQIMLPMHKLRGFLGTLKGKTIGLWGLAFKPNTDDIREAPSLKLIDSLLNEGATVKACDPAAIAKVKSIYPQLIYEKDCYAAAACSHGIIIVTEWDEYKAADMKKVKSVMLQPIIIDGRNAFDAQQLREIGFRYTGIGR